MWGLASVRTLEPQLQPILNTHTKGATWRDLLWGGLNSHLLASSHLHKPSSPLLPKVPPEKNVSPWQALLPSHLNPMAHKMMSILLSRAVKIYIIWPSPHILSSLIHFSTTSVPKKITWDIYQNEDSKALPLPLNWTLDRIWETTFF